MTDKTRPRVLPQWIRSLHIWLSLFGFGATFFFAVTGLTLNHADWFESDTPTVSVQRDELPVSLLEGDVDRLEVAEHLRDRHRIRGRVAGFELGEVACRVTWRNAGYAATADIERVTGTYELTEERRGVVAILDDLHRGAHCGPWWSLLVDAAAVLLVLISATGLWLLCYLKKRIRTGMMLGFLGGATLAISYVWTVR